jgi:hypothetical protein
MPRAIFSSMPWGLDVDHDLDPGETVGELIEVTTPVSHALRDVP